jgi:chromate transporter
VRPSLSDVARAWVVVSTQSVGGGPSTLYLMRRELIERRRWITNREFLEDWAISRLSLGIQLIALAGLIGRRIAGRRGIVVSLVALLVPAATITLLITVGYALIRDQPLVRAALSGAAPVTAGMTAGIAYTFVRQAVRRGRRGAIDYAYAGAACATGLFTGIPSVVVIGVGIVAGATVLGGETSRTAGEPGA